MILVDSSAWVEIIRDGPRAQAFREHIEQADAVLVPSLVLYEVYRVIDRQAGAVEADRVAAYLRSHQIVDLDEIMAITAAKLGREHHLAMGDAVVFATACLREATLVTGDSDFASLPQVAYIPVTDCPGA